MKLEAFFDQFDQLADAPSAVGEMRNLVLQLAVQGRLVSQFPGDEPADVLLVAVSEDRAAFVEARRIARQRGFDSIAKDQGPFALPSGWVWTRLGNLCRVQPGFAFDSTSFVQGDSGVPLIRIRDITKDRTHVRFVGEYREEFLVDPGDYLVGMDGNFTVAQWRGPTALLNQRVSRLQWYSKRIEPSFFAIAAQHRLTELQGTKAYTTVDHLSSKQIEDAIVPLPPLAEQKRIVAKVDGLMALCDRMEAEQQERETRHAALARASLARFGEAPSLANLGYLFHQSYTIPPVDLRKAILSLAVQGKLVPQDPSDTPVDQLLADIQLAKRDPRAAHMVNQVTPMRGVNGEDVPFAVPAAWRWSRLADVTSYIQRGKSPAYGDSDGSLVVSQKCVRWHGLDLGPARRITRESLNTYDDIRFLQDGDLLWNSTGTGTIGRVCVVVSPPDKLVCDSHVTVVRCLLVDPRYVRIWLASDHVYGQIEDLASGSTNQIELTAEMAISQVVPVPPLAEQHRIVTKVDQLMALVHQLEAQLAAFGDTGEKLMQAVVAELTAQEAIR